MGNPKAFLTIHRKEAGYRPVHERIDDFSEVEQTLNASDRREQASRCMDCGVPFCHWACPLGNRQPEWQDRLYKGDWQGAYEILADTCDFPEFTGRVCPALCEKACVLNLLRGAGNDPRKRGGEYRRRFPGRIYPTPIHRTERKAGGDCRERSGGTYSGQSAEPSGVYRDRLREG